MSTMPNLPTILSLAALFASPLSGVVVAWIASRRSKKQTDVTVAVDEKGLVIQEQEANTRIFSAITEGFVERLRDINEAYDKLETRYNALEKRYTNLEARFEATENVKNQMINHIVALEALVPIPPGAPKRPWI